MIIFLNGCSSAGKTSIAQSIQHISQQPWLRVGIDTFIDMLPDRYIAFGDRAKKGYFQFVPSENAAGPTIRIEGGPLGSNFFQSVPTIIARLADIENNLIIDEVVLEKEYLMAYVNSLKLHKVYFIGVYCDLKSMQERETLRGDRSIGLANDQNGQVHACIEEYDFKIDTTYTSSSELAKKILTFIEETPEPSAFKKLLEQ